MINPTMYQLGAKRSCIRDLFEYGLMKAKEIGRENVYDYSLGNPSVPVPQRFSETLRELTGEDSLSVHGYTPAPGAADVRAAVAADLTARFGMEIRAADLFFTCGAAPAMVSVLNALSIPNGEAIVIAPFFPEYQVFVRGSGLKLVIVPADEASGFQISISALSERITPNTQVVVINSPNNPSGVIYSEATLQELSKLLDEKSSEYGHPIYLLADEPYRELVYDGITVPFVPSYYRNTVVCYSYSKSLSLPGDRLGYVCIPAQTEDHDELFAAVAGAARSSGHVCAPAMIQKAVARCTELRPDIEAYDRNRVLLYDALCSFGYTCIKPTGAFYMLIKAPDGDAQAFSDLAKSYNLLLVPGGDFGVPEWLRLSTCVSTEMIRRSLPTFEKVLAEYTRSK